MKKIVNIQTAAALAALGMTLLFAGCGLDDAGPPTLTAPSEFGLSVTVTATPDQLPRDGSSQSTISVLVRDAQGRPVSGQRLSVATTVGSVSQSEVVTDNAGRASFTFIAPPPGSVGSTATIQVIPVGQNASNAIGRTVTVLIMGVTNTTAPTASFTFTPAAPVLKEPVVFDASATTDEGVTCRDACTYSWDFGGEATATGRIVTYQFQAIKTYAVRLTVTDNAGASASTSQNVAVVQGTAPTASFTFSPTSPGQFEIVQFTAEASRVGVTGRTITKYEWKFGDGVNATGVTVSHSYNVLETFPVTLTVTDSAGIQGTTSQNVTVVSGVTADFTISPTNPTVGEAVIFNAEASKGSAGFAGRNPIVSYIWNFGVTTDIVTVGGPRTCTTFPSVKTYTINLTVVDSANRRGTIARTLTVAAGAGAGCP